MPTRVLHKERGGEIRRWGTKMVHRYWHILRLYTIRSSMKRAEYMKKQGIFHSIGDRVMITSRKIPLYSKLISIGSNVWMASGVEFLTHDVTHYMLNGRKDGNSYAERIGCISIGNNVFIGAGAKILYDVKVGDNVVIAAGSLVNKDVPSGHVVGGVPARFLMSFDEYLEKRKRFSLEHPANNLKQEISTECEEEMWLKFESLRQYREGKDHE